MRDRHELTDEHWARIAPPQKSRMGRPVRDHRQMLDAMLWLHATGAQWRDLPERDGPWQSVATRFYRGVASGVWDRILTALQHLAAAGGCRRAPRLVGPLRGRHGHPRAPARGGCPPSKRGATQQALGKSRGGCSTKLHLRAERGGTPIVLLVAAGDRHEQSQFTALLDHGAVKRAGRGRPRLRPKQIVGDKGFSSRTARQAVRRRGIKPVISTKSHEPIQPHFDRALYRERHQVERCINRLKQYRRGVTRYEKLAVTYLAMVTIAAILIWL